MNKTIAILGAALCAITLLAGCARNADGSRMNAVEQWKSWRERQDAAARNFTGTGMNNDEFEQGAPERHSKFIDTTSF